MSAYEQNCNYAFGKKKEDAKENIMFQERLKELCRMAEKYQNKQINKSDTKSVKR